uniref:DM13 domain-containing protein n=1 Tax=Nitrosopumivirus cobalaminus TaxID=3158414 RepID=A0AAU7N4A0_9VIRU
MKRQLLAIPVALAFVALLVFSPAFINTTVNEAADVKDVSHKGKLKGADIAHNAVGNVKVINNESTLRLLQFSTTNGPDLRVYLSTDDRASEFVNLGNLKANNGNQSYSIPEGTDLDKYDTVLIWCELADVAFGTAKLG